MTTKTKIPRYDKAYFIAKFRALPSSKWATGDYFKGNKRCVYGHCMTKGVHTIHLASVEALALSDLLDHVDAGRFGRGPAVINDGHVRRYNQPNPRARILAALNDL